MSEEVGRDRGTSRSEVGTSSRTKILAEMAVVIALGTVLSILKFSVWPQGGSVTAGSMIPLLWFSLRRGARVGVLAGALHGVVQYFAEPYFVNPIQLILDYPVAFGALGLAGLFPTHKLLGVVSGIAGRFVAHFISGVVFFFTFAFENPVFLGIDITGPYWTYTYSALYNGTYLFPELLISLSLISVLIKRNVIDLYK